MYSVASHLITCIDALYGQYTFTLDPQTALVIGILADPVIMGPLVQIGLNRLTYKVTSYFAVYLNVFRRFETYLTNFTNDLCSHHVFANIHHFGTTCDMWGKFDLYRYQNYYKLPQKPTVYDCCDNTGKCKKRLNI